MKIPPSIRTKLLSGSAWAFLGKVLSAGSALAVNALLARMLTPEEMGSYFLLFSIISVAAIFAQLGLNHAVVRLIAESIGNGRPFRARRAIAHVTAGVSIGVTITGVLFYLGGWTWLCNVIFSAALIAPMSIHATLWMVTISVQSISAEGHRGFQDIRLATLFGGVTTTVLTACLYTVIWITQGHSNIQQVALLAIAAGVTNGLLATVTLWGRTKKLQGTSTLSAKDVATLAWPMWLTSLTLYALTQADLWIVGATHGPEDVAIYGAAARTMLLITMPLMIANAVVPPIIAELNSQGLSDTLQRALRVTATVAGLPAFTVLLLMMVFGRPILIWIFGPEYGDGATILAILGIGQMFNVWAGSCGLALLMTGHQKTILWITILGGTITVGGAATLVNSFGTEGIAVAAAAAMAVQNLLMLTYTRRKLGIWTHMHLFPNKAG